CAARWRRGTLLPKLRAASDLLVVLLQVFDRVRDLGLDGFDHRGYFTGRAGGALGKLSHLVGNDREATALLAGARSLDGSVQREQVRLLRDVAYDFHDARNLHRTL